MIKLSQVKCQLIHIYAWVVLAQRQDQGGHSLGHQKQLAYIAKYKVQVYTQEHAHTHTHRKIENPENPGVPISHLLSMILAQIRFGCAYR